MQQPNFYNPQQQNWNAGPPMPGQPMQNGNNPQGGQNILTEQMSGMNINGPPQQHYMDPSKQFRPEMGMNHPINSQPGMPGMPPGPPPMANQNNPPPSQGNFNMPTAKPVTNSPMNIPNNNVSMAPNFNNNLPPQGVRSPGVTNGTNGTCSPVGGSLPPMGQTQQGPPQIMSQTQQGPPPTMGHTQQGPPPTMGQTQQGPPPTMGQTQQGSPPTMGQTQHPVNPFGSVKPPPMGALQGPPTMGTQQGLPPMVSPQGSSPMGAPQGSHLIRGQQGAPSGQSQGPSMTGGHAAPPLYQPPAFTGQQHQQTARGPMQSGVTQPSMPGQLPPPSQSIPPTSYGQPPINQQPEMYQPSGGSMLAPVSQTMQQQSAPSPYSRMPAPQTSYPQGPYNQPPAPTQQQPGMYPPGQMPPPMSGGYQQPYNQMPGQQYQSGPGQYPQAPSQPQRRLDPDQMPNPIQVMAENQHANQGPFITNQAGLVPPLVTTKFVVQDQGNSSPRYVRSSMYNVPVNSDMMKQSAVPFSLIISPLAKVLDNEYPPPIVDFGEIGPIRCIRCKAYMCPFMQFIDAGRRFQCLLCKATTEVQSEYFQHLDHTGQRVDKYERPELVLGTYEFVATKDYCRNNVPPKPPAIVFVIDVSYNNVKSGLVHLLCAEMKNIIKNLPKDQGHDKSVMKVGFITYNNTVHFYNVKSSLAQPQMMVVGDVQEMFMPLLDGFLCDPEESSAVIDALMDQIPKMFGDTRETETILLPAIQAGLEALKASESTGKLLVFHSTLPVAEAPGKLKNRDDRKLLGTEKEKTVLTPQNTAYNNLGQDCVQGGCSVDLFIFNNSYIDLATIGQVARLTGGEVYKYTYFQADLDGHRLVQDVVKNISRDIAFDGVMRVRTSTGIRPTDFYGHFFMSNTTDMEIAAIDSSKSIAIEIKHDDKLSPDENVYIQIALLYTSCGGQRRLRIMNLSLKACTQLADLFRSCDLDTMILFMAKQGLFKLLENTPKAIKDGLIQRAAQILACYRKNCATPSSAGQLILPECMKLLPLYTNCLLKNDAFSGGSDITLDDRSFAIYFVLAMDLPISVSYFYPRLIPIHDVDTDKNDVPPPVRCSGEKMLDDGAFIIENGIYMFLWLGMNLSSEFTQGVFGVPSVPQIDTERNTLPIFENKLSKRVRGIIESIQNEKNRCMRLTLIRQRDKLENVLRHFLIEDRGTDGSASYVDFLCHMHKEIRALLPS